MSGARGSSALFKNVTNGVVNKKFVFPERFKGTFLEKWSNYWKSLYIDYKSMVTDLKTEVHENPRKAILVSSGLVILWQLARNNPDETDFKQTLRSYSNQLMLVGDSCQNPETVKHFKNVESCLNENTFRLLNLGILSLLWKDDFDSDCDIYKAKCDYTKPGFFSIPSRIIDVGFMGRWWNIYIKYQDFDINIPRKNM